MADTANEILDDLDLGMLNNYDEYAQTCVSAWETFSGNNGQMTIVANHIIEAASLHAEQAKQQWPYGLGPSDYVDALYACYDPTVIANAFSDTIEQTYHELLIPFRDSVDLEEQHDGIISDIGGSNYGPHSTEITWT